MRSNPIDPYRLTYGCLVGLGVGGARNTANSLWWALCHDNAHNVGKKIHAHCTNQVLRYIFTLYNNHSPVRSGLKHEPKVNFDDFLYTKMSYLT